MVSQGGTAPNGAVEELGDKIPSWVFKKLEEAGFTIDNVPEIEESDYILLTFSKVLGEDGVIFINLLTSDVANNFVAAVSLDSMSEESFYLSKVIASKEDFEEILDEAKKIEEPLYRLPNYVVLDTTVPATTIEEKLHESDIEQKFPVTVPVMIACPEDYEYTKNNDKTFIAVESGACHSLYEIVAIVELTDEKVVDQVVDYIRKIIGE